MIGSSLFATLRHSPLVSHGVGIVSSTLPSLVVKLTDYSVNFIAVFLCLPHTGKLLAKIIYHLRPHCITCAQWAMRVLGNMFCTSILKSLIFKFGPSFLYFWIEPVHTMQYTLYTRPFRLMRAIARVSTHTNLSAHAICRTHEKSYSAEKVLFHRKFFGAFFSFVFFLEPPKLIPVLYTILSME